ncbi:hypothetical protein [Methanoculleus oceani]|uniref:Uncharacterized protein n=1 Tax=Methanoculleus oceani TaxID=2184756 RepID=A0ABD4T9G4_9EURY|nr:hypothetical protein [Methanoculleus sp. CWC-02]MCM2464763.1 hypothetical protein [Methanoculleus sp. CWC-02]
MTDVNRPIVRIRCPDCGVALQITAEHLRDNKPIVCSGCNKIMTLRDVDRSIDGYLNDFRAAVEEIDRSTKH